MVYEFITTHYNGFVESNRSEKDLLNLMKNYYGDENISLIETTEEEVDGFLPVGKVDLNTRLNIYEIWEEDGDTTSSGRQPLISKLKR